MVWCAQENANILLNIMQGQENEHIFFKSLMICCWSPEEYTILLKLLKRKKMNTFSSMIEMIVNE